MNTKKKADLLRLLQAREPLLHLGLGPAPRGGESRQLPPGLHGLQPRGEGHRAHRGHWRLRSGEKRKKKKNKTKKTKTKTKTKLQKNKNKKTSNITGNNIPYMSICRIYIPGAHRNMASTLARVCVLRHPYSWGPNICNTVTRKVPWYLL